VKWLLTAIFLVLVGMAIPGAWIIAGPLLVVVIIAGIISSIVGAFNPPGSSRQSMATEVYRATKDKLFEALLRIVSDLGHRLQNANKDAGLVVFKTRSTVTTPSGYEGSIVIIPGSDGTCEVRITMGYKGQLWDWGEGKKIARDIFDRLAEVASPLEAGDEKFLEGSSSDERAVATETETPETGNPIVDEFRFWRSVFRSNPARNKKEWLRR